MHCFVLVDFYDDLRYQCTAEAIRSDLVDRWAQQSEDLLFDLFIRSTNYSLKLNRKVMGSRCGISGARCRLLLV